MRLRPAPSTIYRIGGDDPFETPEPPAPIDQERLPVRGGKWFDDPAGIFATLYCGETPEAAFAEEIADYRPRSGVVAAILAATDDPDADADPELVSGRLPAGYFDLRRLGHAELRTGTLVVQVNHPETHEHLSRLLGRDILRPDALSTVNDGLRVTREIGRALYEWSSSGSYRDIAGIAYPNPLDPRYQCVALWPPVPIEGIPIVDPVTEAHPDLLAAAERLGVQLPVPGRRP